MSNEYSSYFYHDSNAESDPKIMQLIAVYGYEGFGWYWSIIATMRTETDYRIDTSGKYFYRSLADKFKTTEENIKNFIDDCISEFKLFFHEDSKIYSTSLIDRMNKANKKSNTNSDNAKARWKKNKSNEEKVEEKPEVKLTEPYEIIEPWKKSLYMGFRKKYPKECKEGIPKVNVDPNYEFKSFVDSTPTTEHERRFGRSLDLYVNGYLKDKPKLSPMKFIDFCKGRWVEFEGYTKSVSVKVKSGTGIITKPQRKNKEN